MKNIAQIILTLTLAGLGYAESKQENLNTETTGYKPATQASLGNYDTPEIINPKNIKSFDDMMKSIDAYMKKNHPDRKIIASSMSDDNNKIIYRLATANNSKELFYVCFDITDAINKLKETGDQKTKKQVEDFLKEYSSDSFPKPENPSQTEPKKVTVDTKYSVESPMSLIEQKDIPSIKKAQSKYIKKTYGKNYGIVVNTVLLDEKQRYINVVFIEKDNNDNHSILIAFDVTEAMKQMINKDKAKFAKIQKSLEEGGGMTTNLISQDW